MPWSEMMLKDFGVIGFYLKHWIQLKKPVVLVCFPHFPSRGATIFRISKHNGWRITNNLSSIQNLAVYWEYGTKRKEWQPLETLGQKRVINLNSRNIGKDFVAQKMQQSMGYSTSIDPLTFEGVAVKKSVKNAVHDGFEIQCPIAEIEPDFVYQKLIDTSNGLGDVMDMRVVIMGSEIPHIYLAYRKIDVKFSNRPYKAELVTQVSNFLSESEQADLLNFAIASGLEYGELDVLRDNADGKIYVVDCNNTPQGPPVHLDKELKKVAIESLSNAFKRQFA